MNIVYFNLKNTTHQITTIVSSLGDGIEKGYRVIEFYQGDYMSGWVEYCTSMRWKAKKRF